MLLTALGVLREVYHLGDALGSVRQLAGPAGVVALAQSCEPFAETLSSVGSRTTNFQFTGQKVDGTGLVFLRAGTRRSADPRTERVKAR